MITTEIKQYQNKTAVLFKVFGHTVHVENYPKYHPGTGSLHMAVKDAEYRFASKMREALTRLDK